MNFSSLLIMKTASDEKRSEAVLKDYLEQDYSLSNSTL